MTCLSIFWEQILISNNDQAMPISSYTYLFFYLFNSLIFTFCFYFFFSCGTPCLPDHICCFNWFSLLFHLAKSCLSSLWLRCFQTALHTKPAKDHKNRGGGPPKHFTFPCHNEPGGPVTCVTCVTGLIKQLLPEPPPLLPPTPQAPPQPTPPLLIVKKCLSCSLAQPGCKNAAPPAAPRPRRHPLVHCKHFSVRGDNNQVGGMFALLWGMSCAGTHPAAPRSQRAGVGHRVWNYDTRKRDKLLDFLFYNVVVVLACFTRRGSLIA